MHRHGLWGLKGDPRKRDPGKGAPNSTCELCPNLRQLRPDGVNADLRGHSPRGGCLRSGLARLTAADEQGGGGLLSADAGRYLKYVVRCKAQQKPGYNNTLPNYTYTHICVRAGVCIYTNACIYTRAVVCSWDISEKLKGYTIWRHG